jgi:hypothetical protein
VSQVIGGRYRLDRELAAGGFGTVWRAFDTVLRVEVAVKQVKIDPTATGAERAKAVARAEHEARNAARLRDHPHIVAVHDVVTDQDAPWLVMQLVEGRSLGQELAVRGRLSPAEAGTIAAAVLSALAAAHEAGIVHRDVKPANIMLAADGTVLLTDFGIAKHHTDTAQTTHGVVIGSLPYMAPERLDGQNLPAGDLFALGATLYEMTEGASPFSRDSVTAIMTAVVLKAPEPPRNAGHLAPVMAALLAKDHTSRPTAREALALLGRTDPAARPTPPPVLAPTVAPAAVPPIAATAQEVVAAVIPPSETDPAHRYGRSIASKMIRWAAVEGGRANDAPEVLAAMALRLAAADPALAERLVDGIPVAGGSDQARIRLAEAVHRADPQRAQRLVARIGRLSGHELDEALAKLPPIDLFTAERLIDAAADDSTLKPLRLCELAEAVAETDPLNAERLARAIPPTPERARALAAVAAAIAPAQAARSRALIEEAVNCAESLDRATDRGEALAHVAAKVAAFDPSAAEQIARAITASAGWRPKLRDRGGNVFATPVTASFAAAMARVASAVARTDPQRARQLAKEAEDAAARAGSPTDKFWSWLSSEVGTAGHLAVAVAATDPALAADLAERAMRSVDDLADRDLKLVEFAVAVAGVRPDLTARVAATMSRPDALDQLVADLAAGHPDVAAHVTAAAPTAASVGTVALADPYRAAGLARAIVDGTERVIALLRLAEQVADRAPDLVQQLCDEAESTVLGDPDDAAALDVLVAAARASADPDRARRLPSELAALARTVPAGRGWNIAQTVAASLIAGFDPAAADALAGSIDDGDEWRLWAFGVIACCLLDGTDPQTWKPATSTIAFIEWLLYRGE